MEKEITDNLATQVADYLLSRHASGFKHLESEELIEIDKYRIIINSYVKNTPYGKEILFSVNFRNLKHEFKDLKELLQNLIRGKYKFLAVFVTLKDCPDSPVNSFYASKKNNMVEMYTKENPIKTPFPKDLPKKFRQICIKLLEPIVKERKPY